MEASGVGYPEKVCLKRTVDAVEPSHSPSKVSRDEKNLVEMFNL